METLLLSVAFIVMGQAPAAGICDRSDPVRVALEKTLNKKCTLITAADLSEVTELKLPHLHIKSFKDNDFAGLAKLKKLFFASLLHNRGGPRDPIAINNNVFASLSGLEELILNEELGRLPDEVFSGLESLRILDLTNSTLMRLPKSMLTLPKIETIYFTGRGLSTDEFELLKATLGPKLKNKRDKK